MKENRIPNVRFCPEVPDEECEGCKLACQGHPLLLSIDASYGYDEVYNKLCTKDCLKYKVPMNFAKESGCYTLKNPDCIQEAMRCDCVAETPKGVKYHPSLKALYERSGAKGIFTKAGYKCPKCGRFYDLEIKNPVNENRKKVT